MAVNNKLAINAIRILSADMIEKAKSGHPGLPLGMAAAACELWTQHLKFNPADSEWIDRDRFVLSGGHGSALIYSLLHLTGCGGLSIDDLKSFRQLDSLTPGHPEYKHTKGIDSTTGPLGAGCAMGVGMAIAEAQLAAQFNEDGYPLFDHYTYVICGDGCLMEGISSEAFSLAGTLNLSKLIVLYDSNKISIEGSTDIAFTEDVKKRMESFGFAIQTVEDGNDTKAIGEAIERAKKEDKPSFIEIKSIIGFGCPKKQGTASVHGEPLGADNITALRESLEWPLAEPFAVPEEAYEPYKAMGERNAKLEEQWNAMLAEYKAKFPEKAALYEKFFGDNTDLDAYLASAEYSAFEDKPEATRVLSGMYLNRIAGVMPNLTGGAADLAPSTKTYMKDMGDFSKDDRKGRNLHFGVRELAMAAIGNGILVHGGLRSYVSTFFVFSDYTKPMARLSSIMKIPAVYVFTHDSIGVGEDGPTHEPIEQLSMLRAMPNFNVWRPCDSMETAMAWRSAIESKETPTALALSRQKLPQQPGSSADALKGGYIISDSEKPVPDAIILASGSEVAISVDAQKLLKADGIDVRVVSMPCIDLFEAQSDEYKKSVLPCDVRKRVAVEAGAEGCWYKYVGLDGAVIAMTGFGASAPADTLFKKYGFTAEKVAEAVKGL